MASIPLPALDIKPPQQPDVAEQFSRLMALRSMANQQQLQQQQIQGSQLANQKAQRDMQVAQKLQEIAPQFAKKPDANGNGGGFDWDGYTSAAASSGATAEQLEHIQGAQKNAADTVLARTQGDAKKIENEAAVNKQAYERLESIRALKDPQQRMTAYQQALAVGKAQGADMSHAPAEPTDDNLNLLEAGLGIHTQALADAKTAQETNTSAASQRKADAETARLNQESAWYKQNGFTPGVGLDQIEAADWLKKNPGKTPSDYMAYKAKLVPQFNFNLQNGAAAGGNASAADVAKQFGMSAASLDQNAERFFQTGQLPQMGMSGARGLRTAIMNRAAELHPNANLAANSAEAKANQQSLDAAQKNFDQVSAFENTAIKNIDLFIEQAGKVVDAGSPWINRPLRAISRNMLGNADVPAYDAARQVAVSEIAKVTNNPGLTGQLSDTARKEVEDFNPKDATLKQTLRVAQVLKQDMSNRHDSLQDQISAIKARFGGGSTSGAKEVHYKVVNGQLVAQ